MVISSLSQALKRLGVDVRIFMPEYGLIDKGKYRLETVIEGLKVPTGSKEKGKKELICNVKKHILPQSNIPVYFLENMEYYEKRSNVYAYSDDSTRFVLLSRGVLEFLRRSDWVPDIINCNDWHTGSLPNYLRTVYKDNPVLKKIKTVFSIHNLSHQGAFDHRFVSEMDFDDGKSQPSPFFSERLPKLNFMKRGIMYNDAVNTVSKTYSREILTTEYGETLDKLLLEVKGKVFGIINGLDYGEFDPATDNLIEHNYDIDSLEKRALNKVALQREFDLPVDEEALLLGFVGRLDYQKGVDLIVNTLRQALPDYNVQFAQVGGGEGGLTQMLKDLKNEFPTKVGIHPYPNFTLPRMVFAGSDCFLVPSRFEPCGIVQLEAMRYGAIPIVRRVGGLADTVENFDTVKKTGNGFVFTNFNEYSLFGQIVRASELYKNKEIWRKLQVNAMESDYSWKHSAKEYEKLYDRAISFKHKEDTHTHKIEDQFF